MVSDWLRPHDVAAARCFLCALRWFTVQAATGGSVTSADQRSPGRPRDPDIDQRVLEAALDIYAQRGWSGLTMHEVARRANIGKAALYLRWSSKEDLVADAFATGSPRFTPEDAELPPRDLLLDIGVQMRRQYTGRFGRALVRLALDADQVPELYQRLSQRFYRELDFGIRALDDAGAADALPPNTGSIALIEALGGAILMRTLFTARWADPHGIEATDDFVRGVVDMLAFTPTAGPHSGERPAPASAGNTDDAGDPSTSNAIAGRRPPRRRRSR